MFISATVAVLMMAAPVPMEKPEKLSPEQRAAVRAKIYGGELATESPERNGKSVLIVPQAIVTAYRTNAAETESLLLTIAEGAGPADSIKAIGYLIELRDGPGAGVPCVLAFDYEAWDKIDRDWKATPRDHWVTQLRKKDEK